MKITFFSENIVSKIMVRDHHLFYNGGQSKVPDIEHIIASAKLITEFAVSALNPDNTNSFFSNQIEEI